MAAPSDALSAWDFHTAARTYRDAAHAFDAFARALEEEDVPGVGAAADRIASELVRVGTILTLVSTQLDAALESALNATCSPHSP
jgi:hypothetical protein